MPAKAIPIFGPNAEACCAACRSLASAAAPGQGDCQLHDVRFLKHLIEQASTTANSMALGVSSIQLHKHPLRQANDYWLQEYLNQEASSHLNGVLFLEHPSQEMSTRTAVQAWRSQSQGIEHVNSLVVLASPWQASAKRLKTMTARESERSSQICGGFRGESATHQCAGTMHARQYCGVGSKHIHTFSMYYTCRNAVKGGRFPSSTHVASTTIHD